MLARKDFDALFIGLVRRFPGRSIGFAEGDHTPVHFFHDGRSICSRRIRSILHVAKQPYVSHVVDLFEHGLTEGRDSPSNAIARLLSCSESRMLVARGTSEHNICPLAMLVLPKTREVLSAPTEIAAKMDEKSLSVAAKLMPSQLCELIKAEIEVVDRLSLMELPVPRPTGRPIESRLGQNRPMKNRTNFCRQVRLQTASNRLAEHPMLGSERGRDLIEIELIGLEKRLQMSTGPRRFGSLVTAADLWWAFELIRLESVGTIAALTDNSLPGVTNYYNDLIKLSAIRKAMIECPVGGE